jgi:hypothetical protein
MIGNRLRGFQLYSPLPVESPVSMDVVPLPYYELSVLDQLREHEMHQQATCQFPCSTARHIGA